MKHPANCPRCSGSGYVTYEEPTYGGLVTETCRWKPDNDSQVPGPSGGEPIATPSPGHPLQ